MTSFAAPPQPAEGAVKRERPILIILHQAHSTPGRVGHMLVERGYRLDMRRPALGDTLPSSTADYAGVVIFGGPMSANDTDAFVKREIDFIDVPLKEETPFLGICLGAQMLAKAIGGRVGPHPNGQVEIGYYDLTPTEAGRDLMDWPAKVYQWHREGFRTPDGTERLASSHHYEEQAFRVGPCAYGLQFHPELTLAMMYRWTTRASERMKLPGARQRRDHFSGRAIYDPPVKAWLSRFLDGWTEAGEARNVSAAEPALKLSA
ncbi:glutamine amidotransferase [Acuticoccus sp. M5D2P5]|uniref:glutamine amidotransferase n=1 Tax=Acuticoccus kalidii TaxID=2910977 RepID=UPI001F2A6DB7|nr:glutamine amidotransferase [Acuticoccus kalidii]MCF3932124.1 glutamine amidotransferase [Acuticoccus kalidii]